MTCTKLGFLLAASLVFSNPGPLRAQSKETVPTISDDAIRSCAIELFGGDNKSKHWTSKSDVVVVSAPDDSPTTVREIDSFTRAPENQRLIRFSDDDGRLFIITPSHLVSVNLPPPDDPFHENIYVFKGCLDKKVSAVKQPSPG
jgi:hypothetical protein